MPGGDPRPAGGDDAARPSGVGSTGDRRVDEVMDTLAELADRPVGEQVAGYEAVHQVLQDTLATVDDA